MSCSGVVLHGLRTLLIRILYTSPTSWVDLHGHRFTPLCSSPPSFEAEQPPRSLFFSLLLQWYNRFIGPALERMHGRSMLFPSFEAVHPPVTLLTPAPADSPSRKHIVLLGRSVLVCPPVHTFVPHPPPPIEIPPGSAGAGHPLPLTFLSPVHRFFSGRQSKGHQTALELFEKLRPWLPQGVKRCDKCNRNPYQQFASGMIGSSPSRLIAFVPMSTGTKLLLVGQLVQGHEPYLRSLQRWVLEHGLSQARGEESSGEIHPSRE